MITRRSFMASAGSMAAAAGIMANQSSASSLENKASLESSTLGPVPNFPRSVMPPNPSSVRREIQEFVDRIMIMDTHEHLLSESRLIEEAEKHLDLDASAEPITHPLTEDYFDSFENGAYQNYRITN